MVKLIVCLICALGIAAVLLQLRQQRLELSYQGSKLHHEVKQAQIKLWNQQLQIATDTAPSAIRQTVKQYDLTLVPSKPYLPSSEDQPEKPYAR